MTKQALQSLGWLAPAIAFAAILGASAAMLQLVAFPLRMSIIVAAGLVGNFALFWINDECFRKSIRIGWRLTRKCLTFTMSDGVQLEWNGTTASANEAVKAIPDCSGGEK